MEKTIFQKLIKEAKYSLNSKSRNLVYQTYGKVEMARELEAITFAEFDQLNKMLVVHGLNDPANCHLK